MSDLDKILSDEPFEDEIEEGQEEAIEDETEEETEEPETEEEETEEEETEPEAETAEAKKPVEKEPPMVPLAALQEVREQLRELKQSMPKTPPKPAPDMFEDPEGYKTYQETKLREATTNLRLDISEELARERHGDETVDEAYKALQANSDPAAYQAIMSSRSPWNELVKWHKTKKVSEEIGADPDKWRQQQIAAITEQVRAELQSKMVAENVKNPPSLAKGTNLGSRNAPPENFGPLSLEEILGEK